MLDKRIYYDDIAIAEALVRHDERITKQFFYIRCYPLFKSIFDNYFTDCESCKEFMDEIYLLTLTPNKKTGRCQLSNYKGESTLTNWFKTVCLYYCYKAYEKKQRKDVFTKASSDNFEPLTDSFICSGHSIEMNLRQVERNDVEKLIDLMPNRRYQEIIRVHYLEGNDNDTSSHMLGMSKANFYNKKKLAREQFISILEKEENYE